MTEENTFTVLQMSSIGVPPYSCRGAKQDLSPIDQAAQLRRDVNGNLQDIGFSGFKKYKSTISCSDQRPPNFGGRWPGLTVVVDCIAELSHALNETPERPAVPGSQHQEGTFILYRPQLTMKIMAMSTNTDEYDVACAWSIDLEEI